MKNCARWSVPMSESLDGRLDSRQEEALRAHLRACPACARTYAALGRTVTALRSLPEIAPPPDMAQRIREKIAAKPPVRRYRFPPALRLAAAASLLFALGLYGLYERLVPERRAHWASPALHTLEPGPKTGAPSAPLAQTPDDICPAILPSEKTQAFSGNREDRARRATAPAEMAMFASEESNGEGSATPQKAHEGLRQERKEDEKSPPPAPPETLARLRSISRPIPPKISVPQEQRTESLRDKETIRSARPHGRDRSVMVVKRLAIPRQKSETARSIASDFSAQESAADSNKREAGRKETDSVATEIAQRADLDQAASAPGSSVAPAQDATRADTGFGYAGDGAPSVRTPGPAPMRAAAPANRDETFLLEDRAAPERSGAEPRPLVVRIRARRYSAFLQALRDAGVEAVTVRAASSASMGGGEETGAAAPTDTLARMSAPRVVGDAEDFIEVHIHWTESIPAARE
jgi:hypothetical protein